MVVNHLSNSFSGIIWNMQIPVNFVPRWYQAQALRALEAGVKLAIWCWSRRGGKDLTAFAYAVKKMTEEPMNVVLVFPTKEQGKEAFWDNVENDGFKTIDHIPKSLVRYSDNTNMKITLINGSTFSLLGAKNPESLRGANGKLYIFSEFVDIPNAALDIIRPIVAVNGGQIILQSTPKIDGISGGTFKVLFDLAKKNPKQFASLITAKEYLDAETLEELRQEAIAKNGNDFWFRQEFLCDWGQASATTYFGEMLKQAEAEGRVALYPHNRDYPVYTTWDIGRTAIVFWQYYLVKGRPKVRIIDYYETSVIGNEPIVKFVLSKPYNYGWHFLPHDGAVREQNDSTTRLEKLRDLGLTNSSLLIREPVEEGIKRAIETLPDTVFHKPSTTTLVTKLYLYKRKYNALTGDYEGPENKTQAHAADSFRYVFVAIEQEFNQETCEMWSQASDQDEYESEMATTSFYDPTSHQTW